MQRTKENIVVPYRIKLNPNAKTRYDEKKRESKDWILTSRAEKRHYKIFWKTINIYILDVSMVYNSPKRLEPVCVRSFDLSMAEVQRRGPVRITLQHFIGRFAFVKML